MRRFLLPVVAALALTPATAHSAEADAAPAGTAVQPTAVAAETRTRPPPSKAEFMRAFTDRWGVPCREYVQHVVIGEETVEASGTVCRAADGSWTLRR